MIHAHTSLSSCTHFGIMQWTACEPITFHKSTNPIANDLVVIRCSKDDIIYGLKQASRAGYQRIVFLFLRIRLMSHDNLYIFFREGKVMGLILYVDDLVMTGSHCKKISIVKGLL